MYTNDRFFVTQNVQSFTKRITFFVHKTMIKNQPVLGTLQNVQSFTNCTSFDPKKAPKISCDIGNCTKISLILGSTVHMTHFAKLKIVTKNLDFARYGPFGIFVTSTFFVIWGARLILVCEKLKSETPFWLLSCIQLRIHRYPKIRNQVVWCV